MEFHFQSCVRGYHEYGEQWTTFLGEQLTCPNVMDQYAVSVKKDSSETVGQVLKKISRICSMFLQHSFNYSYCNWSSDQLEYTAPTRH